MDSREPHGLKVDRAETLFQSKLELHQGYKNLSGEQSSTITLESAQL
jgi:hypothetical protein